MELLGKDGNKVRLDIDGQPYEVDIVMAENGACSILHDGHSYNAELIRSGGGKNYQVNTLFFNDDEHLKAWLLRTAINLSKDLLRSAGRRLRAENEVSASSDFSSPDMQIDVQNAINRLDKKYRIVLYLFYYQGCKTDEIADILGTSKGTVTSRLKRAREKLKLSLSDYEKEMSV